MKKRTLGSQEHMPVARAAATPRGKYLCEVLASALECGNYAHERDRSQDKENASKYYLKSGELLKEATELESNPMRKIVLASLARSMEELSRGRPTKKRPHPGSVPPAPQTSQAGPVATTTSSSNATGDMVVNELASMPPAKMPKTSEKPTPAIEETKITVAVTFQEIAGIILCKPLHETRGTTAPFFCLTLGHEQAKKLLREAVVLPQRFPQLFVGKRKAWKSLLLYGPPGTGKTQLAKAVAHESGSKFYSVSSADIMSSLVGGSEKKIRELFAEIRKVSCQVIIFMDEIDSLCRKRTENEDEHIRRVKTELLRQIEGVDTQNSTYFLLAATNCPWEIDTAFLRRFQKRIYVGLPTLEERELLFQIQLQGVYHTLSPQEIKQIAAETEGFSGSDISSIVSDTLMEPVRDLEKAKFFRKVGDVMMPCSHDAPGSHQIHSLTDLPPGSLHQNALRPLAFQDMQVSVKRNHRTNQQRDLLAYEKFHTQ